MYPRGHHLVAASLCGLARAELLSGNLVDAETHARAGLEMLQRTRKPDHPDLCEGLEVFGAVLLAKGEATGAAGAFSEAARIASAAKPPAEGQLVGIRTLLGRAEMELGRLDPAQEHLTQALSSARSIRGDRSYTTLSAASALFELYTRQGDAAKAASIRSMIESTGN
jgi:cytochrome c-type biogenesis protein CcmH/NrfG